MNGPAPIGLDVIDFGFSRFAGAGIRPSRPESVASRPPAAGRVVVIVIVCSSVASTLEIASSDASYGEPFSRLRSRPAFTASASKALPSWKVMPGRSFSTSVVSSGVSHDSTCPGWGSPRSFCWISVP